MHAMDLICVPNNSICLAPRTHRIQIDSILYILPQLFALNIALAAGIGKYTFYEPQSSDRFAPHMAIKVGPPGPHKISL